MAAPYSSEKPLRDSAFESTPAASRDDLMHFGNAAASRPNPYAAPDAPRKKRKGLIALIAAIVIVIIIAIVLIVYFVAVKPKHDDNGTTSGGKPAASNKLVVGTDGTTVITEAGTNFTYKNKFGGYFIHDPSNPYNDGAKAQSYTPALNETWKWGVDRILGCVRVSWRALGPLMCAAA